ncbi:MAG: esterase [Lachnospiraceae bacterium]|nr:esterase [Lachnospiraceae bacterium]
MKIYEFGNPDADLVLIQPSDEQDLSGMESEVSLIQEQAGRDFRLIALLVDDWNKDLSPWEAPPVFGKEPFGSGAEDTLQEVLKVIEREQMGEQQTGVDSCPKTFIIGGYSLAGLFALWAVYQTDVFAGVAAGSPSMWFPGFVDYMKEHEIGSRAVYLSLGDKEEKARNPVMSTVGDCIREAHRFLSDADVTCTLEWNQGNHFKEPDLRMAKAFLWTMQNI